MTSLLLLLLLGGAIAAAGTSGSFSGASRGSPDPDPDPDPSASDPSDPTTDPTGGSRDDSSGSGVPVLPASAYDIGWAGLSDEEQLIVELINRARMDPQAEVSRLSEPLASGIPNSPVEALAVVPTLSDAAEAHSEDMDDREFFSHTNPDNEGPGARALAEGHGSSYVGENIGWIGSTSTSFDQQTRAEAHHENLWESDGHQRNLMSDNWSEIGVGYDYGDLNGYSGSTLVTEMFSDRGINYLTGVVIEDGDGDDFYDMGEGQGDVRITAWDGTNSYATATWDSGGYALALPPGTYTVRFEGGDLDVPYETQVTIGTDNVKLDVLDPGGSATATVTLGAVSAQTGLPLTRMADTTAETADEVLSELELV